MAEVRGSAKDMQGPSVMPTTFRSLESEAARTAPVGKSPLEQWYESIRDVPIQSLSDADLARACRQQLHIQAIAPIVLSRLEENPLAGMLYDGELLRAACDAFVKEPRLRLNWREPLRDAIQAALTTLPETHTEVNYFKQQRERL